MKVSTQSMFVATEVSKAFCATPDLCCASLKNAGLLGKVVFPNETLYDTRLATYYSANAALAPWCMVLPESSEDVSKAIRTISELECPFGIRSGGHSSFVGSSSVKDGVTIDLGMLKMVTYDDETNLAHIEIGTHWGLVYSTLDLHGVTVVGGRTDGVGIGGFITGGGYSFHSGRFGWAADVVENFEVVLASGEIVNANKDENSDLFRALKGSSGNLGIVTRLDTPAVQDPTMWGGYVTYYTTDAATREEVFKAYQTLTDNLDNDPASQIIHVFNYGAKTLSTGIIMTNSEGKVAPSPAFDSYRAIANTSDTTRIGPIAELVPEFTGHLTLGVYSNWYSGSVSNAVVPEFLEFYFNRLNEFTAKMEAQISEGSNITIIGNMQPVTPGFVKKSVENGGNVLGLEAKVQDGPLAAWLFSVTADNAEDQPIVQKGAVELVNMLEEYATSIGGNKDWHYLNYADGVQDPIAAYGDEAVAMIRAVADKYDPNGVFQKLRHSGFKIPVA